MISLLLMHPAQRSISWPLAASLVFTLFACSPHVTADGGTDVVLDTAIDARIDARSDALDRAVPDSTSDGSGTDTIAHDGADATEAGSDVPLVDAPAEAGDAAMPCTTAATCPLPGGACVTAICTPAGICDTDFVAALVATPMQSPGDCHRTVCDGAGNVLNNVDDADVPDDGNPCTMDVCTSGLASHPLASAGAPCGGTNVCDAAGLCVGCVVASDCGASTACHLFACTSGVCSSTNVTAGTVVSNAPTGNCRSDQCDGLGSVAMNAIDDTDHPVDDGLQCTVDTCNAGLPVHPPAAQGATCSQGGRHECNATGQCVACLLASECPAGGTCQSASCTTGVCGFVAAVASVLPVAQQVAGNCQLLRCDGTAQTPVSQTDDSDVPPDDGNPCTLDTCLAGSPVHPPAPASTPCGPSLVCDGAGHCGNCASATDCPAGNACQNRECNAGVCGFTFVSSGTVVANPAVGDCRSDQCDGAGNITAAATDPTDLPVDGNQCTLDVCTAGVASNPPASAGTPCSQGGGTLCDGTGACLAPLAVLTLTPSDGGSARASTPIAVTFNQATNPATLTAQTAVGACSGSIQVSVNDFASCAGFTSATPAMTGSNTIATLVPAPGLLVNRTYKVRVTTAATSAAGGALPATFTSPAGFSTTNPLVASSGVVISQVYGGGGNTGAPYRNDFIELHNRGTTSVSVAGWSVQYASATGTSTWLVTPLAGTILPGGYYLVQEAAGAGTTGTLPAPNATGTIAMSSTSGKVALLNVATALTGACPASAAIVDLVGFGTTANCSETAPAPAPSNTTSALRGLAGCTDTSSNAADFVAATPTPRNDTSTWFACTPAQNEAGSPGEVAYCVTQFPLALTVQTGMASPLVYGRIYQSGLTEAPGSNAGITAQFGYGPAAANPEYEAGWNWLSTVFNVQIGNNDEYQTTFTAPGVGAYRYSYRFSLDGGATWTYCDNNQGDTGAGANPGLAFDFEELGVLDVTP